MRIAFIVGQFPALSQTFIVNQIIGLLDRGHEVDIYTRQRGDISKVSLDVEKYALLKRTYYIPIPSNKWLRMLKGIFFLLAYSLQSPRLIAKSLNTSEYGQFASSFELLYWIVNLMPQKRAYDIIHCHFGRQGLIGAILRDTGVLQGKLITTFHGADVNAYPKSSGIDVYKPLFQKGDLYTGNTKFTMDKAVALGCPKEKLIKLRMGIDLSKYSFQTRLIQREKPIKIITVGRLVEKKGIEYSIRAVAKISKKYPNILYRIIGNGELHEHLENLIAELAVSDKIKLLGGMSPAEVCHFYADSHLFILSSVTAENGDQEGQGLVLQEAQAMGLPVLSTLHNGIPEGVQDGKAGFLVPEKDIDALADKLQYLLANQPIWVEMGKAGREFVEKNYDINQLNNQLVEVYQRLVEGKIIS